LSFIFIDRVQSKILGISYNIYTKQRRVEGSDFTLTPERLDTLDHVSPAACHISMVYNIFLMKSSCLKLCVL